MVHLLTKDSIEERVWETLKLKKSLFAGVFDSPTGEVSFAGGVFVVVRCTDGATWRVLEEKGHVLSRSGRAGLIFNPLTD